MNSLVKIVITNGSMQGATYTFDEAKVCLIGRAYDCIIQFPDIPENSDISRHHCAIHIDPPLVWVNDLASKNGTFVNGLKIDATSGRIEIHDNDELRVGPLVLRINIGRQETEPAMDITNPEWVP